MLTKKFLASAVATIATAGAIGVAIAQTTTPSAEQPNPPVNSTSDTTTGTAGDTSTSGTTGSTAGSSSTMTAQSGADSTVSSEAAPQADRG